MHCLIIGGNAMDHDGIPEKRLFIIDMLLLIIFLISTIAVFGFVLLQILNLPGNKIVTAVILTVSSITVVSMIWASVEVLMHLKRNKDHIYKEDFKCQKYILEQKRALLYEKH